MNDRIAETELILNPDGSVYHLHLQPSQVAENVIVVGDPDRVGEVSKFFDQVELEIKNREFVTHIGLYNGKRINVISTGIGTDNIDIVLNELDAAVNIDLIARQIKKEKKKLNIVRIGTSGTLQADVPVDSFVFSNSAIGFDGLLNYYADKSLVMEVELSEAFIKHIQWDKHLPYPYAVNVSEMLKNKVGFDLI